MDFLLRYPSSLPPASQPAVEQALVRAELAFRQATATRSDDAVFQAAFTVVTTVVGAFATQARAAQTSGLWSTAQLRNGIEEFLEMLTYHVYELTGMRMVQHRNGYWRPVDYSRDVMERVHRSEVWREHLTALEKLLEPKDDPHDPTTAADDATSEHQVAADAVSQAAAGASDAVTTVTATKTDLKNRRATLLKEYKLATGVTANKPIYENSKSGIHKPEFYKWQKGELPATSATAINFERFLAQKPAAAKT